MASPHGTQNPVARSAFRSGTAHFRRLHGSHIVPAARVSVVRLNADPKCLHSPVPPRSFTSSILTGHHAGRCDRPAPGPGPAATTSLVIGGAAAVAAKSGTAAHSPSSACPALVRRCRARNGANARNVFVGVAALEPIALALSGGAAPDGTCGVCVGGHRGRLHLPRGRRARRGPRIRTPVASDSHEQTQGRGAPARGWPLQRNPGLAEGRPRGLTRTDPSDVGGRNPTDTTTRPLMGRVAPARPQDPAAALAALDSITVRLTTRARPRRDLPSPTPSDRPAMPTARAVLQALATQFRRTHG